MRKSTKGKGFVGAVITTVVTALVMFLLTAALLTGYFSGGADAAGAVLVLLCALLYLAIAAGVIAALWQRWKEIQSGEEDEAKKY